MKHALGEKAVMTRMPLVLVLLLACPAAAATQGVEVRYRLPTEGPLPKTYLVTLAVVRADNPSWILGQFVRGEPRTVTAENQGKFTERWDGLDDNLMPLPPGAYGVKGIYMPAGRWAVDGEFHAVVPRFVAGASSWMPSPEQWNLPEPFGGDPCGAPVGDIDVGDNGTAVLYYQYLENGTNNPMFDLHKPVGLGQFLRAFPSGGAGGGTSTCTDGQTVWSFSTDGGPKYVYRADGRPFGSGRAQRTGVYLPEGWVCSMACGRDAALKKTFVYVAQGGKIVEPARGAYEESEKERVDRITVHDGDDGKLLADLPLPHPVGIAVRNGNLYAVHVPAEGPTVSVVPLKAGLPQGAPRPLFTLPKTSRPGDIAVDSRGRIYVSDTAANKVLQFDAAGKLLRSYGNLDAQKPGQYDRLTLIAPGKLATWRDGEGNDRLLIVEHGGPNRVSEWDDQGQLLREFLSLQTHANDGYAVDPEHPNHVYIAGQQGWLTRFAVDYRRGVWTVDAVWPNVGTDPQSPGFDHPQFVRVGGRCYLACGRSNNVYRLEGDRWVLSAAIVRQRHGNDWKTFAWHDSNGNGAVDEEEFRDRPLEMPGWLFRYHGNQWLSDLSLAAINQNGPDVWRLAPEGFDGRGNPIFRKWTRLFADPVFQARAEGKATALFGGNELAEAYTSDWAMVDGSLEQGFYVYARGGRSFSANEGAQGKLARYLPDGAGGYRLAWRTGRIALQGTAQRGEIYGAIHVWKPINGLVSLVDQSRCGVLLYTEDGLYVDTVFPDPRRYPPAVAGVYPQPGEFFAGSVYSDPASGKVYFGMGKVTPMVFEARGWSLTENPVRPLETVQRQVTLAAPQIADPPEIALALRGGAGAARVARFAPALGGAVLDGSPAGWESCEPVRFQADKDQSVEVRLLYDPENLYLRWHARTAGKVSPKPLAPFERLFAHDRGADTLSFYIQGDPAAGPGSPDGRPGDVRIVFGLFQDGGQTRPVALGMYPAWKGAKARPATYRTPVNTVEFAHVELLEEVRTHAVVDDDGKGFVLTAAIPRTAIPGLPAFGSTMRTMVNFEATYDGHNKFWWSNADGSANRETYDEPTEARLYPGSWAPALFQGIDRGVVVRHWQLCGPFGGPGAERFAHDLNGKMPGTDDDYKQAARAFCEAAKYPLDDGKVDLQAAFSGPMVRGYWNDPGRVTWKKATIDDLDTRVACGPSAQVWYGATWLYVPEEVELDFLFQGHPQTYLRWFLNGQKVRDGEIPGDDLVRVAAQRLTLHKGWNQVMFRGYCVGYPPFRAGLVLSGPPERLWKLRLSAEKP